MANRQRILPWPNGDPALSLLYDLANQQDHEEEVDKDEEVEEQIGGGDLPMLLDEEESQLPQFMFYSMMDMGVLQLQELLFETEPETEQSLPQDLKKKGVDVSCSLEFVYKNPPRRLEVGECSTTDCVICNCSVPSGGLVRTKKCNHSYCRDCFRTYLGEQIQEDITQVNCPESKCNVVLKPRFCSQFLPKEVYRRWMDALTESSVLANPVWICCPFAGCGNWFVDDEKGFLIRACPHCWKIFCMNCEVAWHMGRSCKQFQMELLFQKSRRTRRRRNTGEPDRGGQKVFKVE
ncbi:uncharacterized protein LOC130787832 [Actinidia eriantha]|uniref:uncharacterized protein LOC130787832 n=1 Tax=Actinidia eriantha TaxID=165200 RepID=UPI002582A61A|nr:uncharacterized protein LOC130787832 [Actinidia eriantha]